GHLAFAHYPKTAGSSLTAWFRRSFPDASYVEPGNCHMPVRRSLEHLGLVASIGDRPRLVRECLRIVQRLSPARCDLPIIGVVREPFEMLISLYEYWRRCEFAEEPAGELIQAARTGTFRTFLGLAVGEKLLANYETYFDVGGPAWATTRLIDFQCLRPGLAAVCQEFGIDPPAEILRMNAAPRRHRDAGGYLAEAGAFVFEVRSHFRWYYDEAVRIMVRGPAAPSQLRLAA
ncbi:MAG: Sulfotransferase family, partial [Planctomycetota bacterium]